MAKALMTPSRRMPERADFAVTARSLRARRLRLRKRKHGHGQRLLLPMAVLSAEFRPEEAFMTDDALSSPSSAARQPEYELADPDDQYSGSPEFELVDDSPPPPDDLVIRREEARLHLKQRSWVLWTFIVVFIVVIGSDVALSAWLPPKQWAQTKPEIEYIRNSLFTFLGVIIGYYFGERRRR